MKKLIRICVVAGLVLAATNIAHADMMYADHVTAIYRGDTTIGDFLGFYGGTYPGSYPVELTEEEARAAVLGSPDGNFLSLPGKDDTPDGTELLYAYVEVGFPNDFCAEDFQLVVTELFANQESAHLWIWTLDGSYVQPLIQRNGSDTIVVDLSPFASFVGQHGVFTRVGIGGLDLRGGSQGFDLDAVGVTPVPSAVILGSIGLTFTGWLLRRRKML